MFFVLSGSPHLNCQLPLQNPLLLAWLLARLPPRQMLLRNIGQCADPGLRIVEAGDIAELLAAGMQEGFFGFHGDFFQRFEAIHRKTGADDLNALDAPLR